MKFIHEQQESINYQPINCTFLEPRQGMMTFITLTLLNPTVLTSECMFLNET